MAGRCVHRVAAFQCDAVTRHCFYVSGMPGSWHACGHHSRTILKGLMEAFKGHGVYSRRDEK